MIKVYQDRFGEGGNCMQAAMASLFDKELYEVPDFVKYDKYWGKIFIDYPIILGYKEEIVLFNENLNPDLLDNFTFKSIEKHEGINGYFYASIGSPSFFKEHGWTHAVIIDKNFNIVHDPHPEYQNLAKYPDADKIGYNGIRQITIHSKNMKCDACRINPVSIDDKDGQFYNCKTCQELKNKGGVLT